MKSLIVFVVLVLGGGIMIGTMTAPGSWYAELAKPSFNPPNWIFGPVWTVIYLLIAVAGWRLWQRDPSGTAMKIWGAQLALNFAWSPIFFSAQQIGIALVVIVLLLVTILTFIVVTWPRDRLAAWLFVPYAAWVSFATLLNGSILLLN
ncbi:MAG: TspO/MBR family protein [Pseudomonadota bacterium]